ncbi:hypothetical protein ABT168_09965 [Streptomyces sp. NPDC001793]|uniref:hypothetical protein n=1 Tax=Streptomyces sp. NPDC001793 TaxID=3154657 RepID=UPI00331CF274
MNSKPPNTARPGRHAGPPTAVRTAVAGAAVALALPAAAALAERDTSTKPTSAFAHKSVGDPPDVRTVKLANGDTLRMFRSAATATLTDPYGGVIGVLTADRPGPVTSDSAGEGHTWTYTMDQAISTITVIVQHDGTTQSFSVTKPRAHG